MSDTGSARSNEAYNQQVKIQKELLDLSSQLGTEEYNRLTNLNQEITTLSLIQAKYEDLTDENEKIKDTPGVHGLHLPHGRHAGNGGVRTRAYGNMLPEKETLPGVFTRGNSTISERTRESASIRAWHARGCRESHCLH